MLIVLREAHKCIKGESTVEIRLRTSRAIFFNESPKLLQVELVTKFISLLLQLLLIVPAFCYLLLDMYK